MAGRHEGSRGFGSQDEWPYSGSGPSGSSEIEAGLAQLEALRYVDVSGLPSGQDDAPQDTPPPTADELRESLREIAETHGSTAPAAPPTPGDIRAALHGGAGTHEAPAPQTVEEIKEEEKRRALWCAEETLRNAPEVLDTAANELMSIISIIRGGNVPASAVRRLNAVVQSLRGINLHDLDVARLHVGTEAYGMDMEANNRQ